MYSLADKAPEKGGCGPLRGYVQAPSPAYVASRMPCRLLSLSLLQRETAVKKSPKRLSQGLNETLQADWMELGCTHPPSSDTIGITIITIICQS